MSWQPDELKEVFICPRCEAEAGTAQVCSNDGAQMIHYDVWLERKNSKTKTVKNILFTIAAYAMLILFVLFFFMIAHYLYDIFILGKGYQPMRPFFRR